MKRGVLLAALALAGCEVWDQSVFAPTPEAMPAPEPVPVLAAPPRIDPRAALIVIDYAAPNPDYREMLRYAVRAAEGRGRSVKYDVIAVVKTTEEIGPARERAAQVMRAIMAERVPSDRIRLGLRAEPAMPSSQVRVYVR